jgi:hypothetical protein
MATNLSLEQMKQIVRQHFEDFVNKKDAAVIRKNMTPSFYDHDGPGGKPTGVDGDEKMMLNMYKAMPDLHLTDDRRRRQGPLPQYLALDGRFWQENAVSRLCALAFRGRQDCRALGHGHSTL